MQIAKIKITNNVAVADRQQVVTSGMVGATVAFELDELWDGLTLTAVFQAGCLTRDVLDVDPEGTVIPWEVLAEPGQQLKCGLYGVNGAGDLVIPTTWAHLGTIRCGADPSGDPGTEPTPEVWEQLRQDIEELRASGGGGGSISVVPDGDALVITTSMSVTTDGDAIIIGGT